ncbi:MAG: hypothetical protein SGPRY_005779 [Prymnesium sp.]
MDARFALGSLLGAGSVLLIEKDPVVRKLLYMLGLPLRTLLTFFLSLEWEAHLILSLLAALAIRAWAVARPHSVAVRLRLHTALRSPWIGLGVAAAVLLGALAILAARAPGEQQARSLGDTGGGRVSRFALEKLGRALLRMWPALVGLAIQSVLPLVLHPSVVGSLLVLLLSLFWPKAELRRHRTSSRQGEDGSLRPAGKLETQTPSRPSPGTNMRIPLPGLLDSLYESSNQACLHSP